MAGSTDARNIAFWDELCGTALAQRLGVTDDSRESLRRFDDWYMDFYPYLLRHVPLQHMKGRAVLEVGLGYGTLSERLAKVAGSYTGLDIARGPVVMATHRFAQLALGSSATAVQGSILSAPFGDERFDRIITIGCLHHTGDLQQALDEVHRLLRPGGVAVIMVYSAYSYRRWLRSLPDTLRHLAWDKIGWGAPTTTTAVQRALYDRSAGGGPAPETVFTGRRQLASMLTRFEDVVVRAENVGNDAPFRVLPRRHALRLGRYVGLDLYCAVRKPYENARPPTLARTTR